MLTFLSRVVGNCRLFQYGGLFPIPKRELLHHGRWMRDEEKTEIRVVSGETNLIILIETSVVVAEKR